MIEVKKDQMNHIATLFAGSEDSMVISCLQGYMGNAYAETLDHPKAALIVSGEYSFFAGDPNSMDAMNLVKSLFDVNKNETTIVIFDDDNPEWEKRLLSVPENNPVIVPRFGIVQKDYEFDDHVLRKYIDALPEGFDLVRFDKNRYEQAMREEWSKEFCEVFSSAEDYLARGFGFAVLENGRLVSGASTMTIYDGGVEIQVATDEKYRGRGLAMSCAAALVRECSRRKIRPCWDAANLISKKMALDLGYEYKGEYTTIHMKKSHSHGQRELKRPPQRMEIIIVESNKKDFLDLLILADEQESMIDKYLERGELFALYDGDLKSICVVTRESDDVCELKNIATYEKWQGKGYGSKLLNHIFSHYKGKYGAMLVGTGDSPWILQFYQKNGFRISHRIKDFFTDNYDHPIFEDGVQLVDMVYLKRNLEGGLLRRAY